MIKQWILVVGCIALTACVTTHYVGRSYPATASVDVYFDAFDIARPYEVMGYMNVEDNLELSSMAQRQRKAESVAREKGADAILLEGLRAKVTTTEEVKTDGQGGATRTISHTKSSERPLWTAFSKIALIKYK